MDYKRSRSEARWHERGGLVSRVLLQGWDFPETLMMVAWVDVAPGSGQRLHRHASEQVNVSAATPAGDREAFYDAGPLRARQKEGTHGW